MEVPSVLKLSLQLISSAFQRCRLSDDLCRLSVLLDRSGDKVPPMALISISDTGIGSSLEEFQSLKYNRELDAAQTWDGVLAIRTTKFSDNEVYWYHLNLNESISSRRPTRLPSQAKNGARFSGTEVSLCVNASTDVLLAEIAGLFQKMLVLQIPNVTMDLVIKQEGSPPDAQYQSLFVVNNDQISCLNASNVERLKFGLMDYVLKHGNHLKAMCDHCFSSREHLKVGSGKACNEENNKRAGVTMEAVIVISELLETTNLCSRSCNGNTEVLYFKDFSPSPIPDSPLNALKSIDWKRYGLMLAHVNDQDGHVLLEWQNFPPYVQIDIVLHWTTTSPARQRTQPGLSLAKKAIKHALDDLKAKHEGFLLSSHALKICSYVPDLARSIAGLIFSSQDTEFQGDCLSLLGFQSQQIGRDVVEDCIKEKIVSVIGMNDRRPQKAQEAAPSLFFDGGSEELFFEDEESEVYEG